MELHTQPVVEVHHGHLEGFVGDGGRIEQATMAFSCAPLGRIQMDHTGKETSGLQRNGYNAHGESSNVEADLTSFSSSEVRHPFVLQGGYNGHPKVYNDMETGVARAQRVIEEDGMKYGGGSHDEY